MLYTVIAQYEADHMLAYYACDTLADMHTHVQSACSLTQTCSMTHIAQGDMTTNHEAHSNSN